MNTLLAITALCGSLLVTGCTQTGEEVMRLQSAPPHETLAHETLAHETLAHVTPAHVTPAHVTLAHATPAPAQGRPMPAASNRRPPWVCTVTGAGIAGTCLHQ